MRKFEIDGIPLIVPGHLLDAKLEASLAEGRYEGHERAALLRFLRPGDRVLDLGAGTGLLSIIAARVVGAGNVVAVEAAPGLYKALFRNLRRNGAAALDVLKGAIVPDSYAGDTVAFTEHGAFWASSLARADAPLTARGAVEVPALRFSQVMAAARPSVVIMDIEGAEADLCLHDWPADVRLIIMEAHPARARPGRMIEMFDGLARNGFEYLAWSDTGPVLVFARSGSVTPE